MFFGLFQIGNYTVSLADVIVAAVCVVGLTLLLVFIISDIKKQSRKKVVFPERKEASEEKVSGNSDKELYEAAAKAASSSGAASIGVIGAADKKQAKRAVKAAVRAAKNAPSDKTDPVVALLGFDPYAPVDTESCEIAETFYDTAQETEDMRVLREKMRVAAGMERKISELKARQEKIIYELGKVSRYLRDNRVVIVSAEAVGEKLRQELNSLTADKKTAKKNKDSIMRVSSELENSVRTAEELKRNVELKSAEERMLKEAQSYIGGELSRAERDLSFVNADIDRLNESVGLELKKIENDNRARALMNKYRELKPLLVDVNSAFRAIGKLDASLNDVHASKHELRVKLDGLMADLKTAYGPGEAQLTSQKVGEINKRMLVLDAEEENLIRKKEDKINEFKSAKRRANEFLDGEKYELEDIVVAEDKVVGELEYEQLKTEYETKKDETAARYAAAQSKYDQIISRKIKFKKNQDAQKRAYEEEIQSALKELKAARTESEKAANDFDRILPSLSPMSLVASGSGVISKERLSRRASVGAEKDLIAAERVRRETAAAVSVKDDEPVKTPEPSDYPVRRQTSGKSSNLPAGPSASQLDRLMNRLNELERIAVKEKEQRALARAERGYSVPMNKIERRKAQVVNMRKNLKYIDSPRAAREFKHKLYQLSISLDEEELSDNVLSEMIRRTMNEATYLGEKAGEKRYTGRGYRSPYDLD